MKYLAAIALIFSGMTAASAQVSTSVVPSPCANFGSVAGTCVQGMASTAWTPTDGSGAALTFTSVNTRYIQTGNMVCVFGSFVYPANANASQAIIAGLPVAVPNQNYAYFPGVTRTNAALPMALNPVNNTSTMQIFNSTTGVAITNTNLTGATLWFNSCYPAA